MFLIFLSKKTSLFFKMVLSYVSLQSAFYYLFFFKKLFLNTILTFILLSFFI